jgi:hypothetical protein
LLRPLLAHLLDGSAICAGRTHTDASSSMLVV